MKFIQSTGKLHAAAFANSIGTNGITVTTNVWYLIDVSVDYSVGGVVITKLKVDGVDASTVNPGAGSDSFINPYLGILGSSVSGDVYFDDFLLSNSLADYPIGRGKVLGYSPVSDATHSITTAFQVGTSATTITNATTTAYTRINSVPVIKAATASLGIAQVENAPSVDQWVECNFTPNVGIPPQAVEVLVSSNAASGNPCTAKWQLNDNGTISLITNPINPGTAGLYVSAQFGTAPSTGLAWTQALFNALKIRFGYSTDANPDIYGNVALIEAAFPEFSPPPKRRRQRFFRQSF